MAKHLRGGNTEGTESHDPWLFYGKSVTKNISMTGSSKGIKKKLVIAAVGI
jgi:hypothetical protein